MVNVDETMTLELRFPRWRSGKYSVPSELGFTDN
jgi:hypothetical protein